MYWTAYICIASLRKKQVFRGALKLSTAEPGKSATKPTLDKWALNYGYDVNDGFLSNEINYDQRMTVDKEKAEAGPISGYETIQVDELSQETINLKR